MSQRLDERQEWNIGLPRAVHPGVSVWHKSGGLCAKEKARDLATAGVGFAVAYGLQAGDALALFDQLAKGLFGLGQLGALLVEYLGRRLGDEALVGQLAADALDLA